jgi:hypothetical protein
MVTGAAAYTTSFKLKLLFDQTHGRGVSRTTSCVSRTLIYPISIDSGWAREVGDATKRRN